MESLIDLIRVHVECDEQNSRSREWRGQTLDGTEKGSGNWDPWASAGRRGAVEKPDSESGIGSP